MTLFIFLFDSWNYITEYQSIGSSNLFEHLVFIWKWRSLTIGYCLQVDIPVLQSKIHVTLFLALLKLFPPLFYFFKKRDVLYFLKNIYVFLDRGEWWEKDRERNINVWLPLTHPQLGIWPATQADMCPDWELNQQSFGSQAGAQSTEPHQPGYFFYF